MAERNSKKSNRNGGGTQRALIGAGLAAAATAGAAAFLLSRRNAGWSAGDDTISDAPDHVLRSPPEATLIGRTVTINKARQDLYDAWRNYTRFPEFMENVRGVEDLGDGRSRWTIEAPAGTSVELVVRTTEDRKGELIAWATEPESDIETEGRVEFSDAGPGRGTMVRFTSRYTAPGGAIGRGIAKILQREPNVQARRDLRRFKQLMETGEVTTNASPSGRKNESPTEARI